MFGGVNAGSAFVTLSPDMSGFQQQVGAQMSPVTDKFGKLGKAGGVAFAAAAAAVGVGKILYDIGQEFDDAFDTIQTGTGATGQKLDGLKSSFKNVVSAVPADFGDAAQAIAGLNQRLDITGKPLERLSKQFLELSRITDTDIDANVSSVTRAFGDWQVKTKDQSRQLDTFFVASQKSGASVEDLAKSVVQFGAPLRQVGFSLDEATAMFANFEKAGVNTQTMMPGLKFALKSFMAEGIDPKKGLERTFEGIANGTISATEAFDIFGQRATPDMIEAIRQGRFNLDGFTRSIKAGGGEIMKSGRQTMDFNEHLKVFTNQLKVLVEPVATRVFAAVGNAMKDVSRFLRQLSTEGTETNRKFGPIFDAMKLGAKGLWLAYKFFIGNIVKAFKGIAAVVRAVDDAVNFLQKLPNKVGKVFSNVVSAISGFFKSLYQKGRQAASNVIDGVTSFLSNLPGKFFTALKNMAERIGSTVSNAVKSAVNSIIDLFNNAVPDKISVPKLPDINLPDNPIPKLRTGTHYWRGGPAIIGEAGPELMNLPRGSRVTGASATRRIIEMASRPGGSGMRDMVFNVETIGGEFPDEGHLLALMGSRLRAMGLA